MYLPEVASTSPDSVTVPPRVGLVRVLLVRVATALFLVASLVLSTLLIDNAVRRPDALIAPVNPATEATASVVSLFSQTVPL